METLLLIARLILTVVFGLAGAAKLADRAGSYRALTGFGVPEELAKPLAWFLPLAEIVVALALLPLATAWFGGLGALVLLLAFLVGIGVNLVRGKAPDCHCFGRLHSEPVSWNVFARNAALAALAGFIVASGQDNVGLSATAWMKEMNTSEWISLLLSVAAVALLVPVVQLLRRVLKQQAALLETVTAMKKVMEEDYSEPAPVERADAAPPVEGLPVGAPAPEFSLATLAGGQLSLAELLAWGNPVLLLFVSSGCSPCRTLLPQVRAWQRDYGDFLTIALLSKGTEKEVRGKLAKYEAQHVLLQGESSIADEYQAKWTPAAVLIDRGGKIASPVTFGDVAIRALVTHAVATAELMPRNGSETKIFRPQIKLGKSLFNVGESAPRFALPNLDGEEISLDRLLGKETLLLFWNPGCSFCQAMADDLIRWETKPNGTQLVFISSGEAVTVKKESDRFRSLFLHDAEFDIAPMFGASGTPSAVLLDSTGRIASSLAVGEQNILALLGIRKIVLPVTKRTASPHLESVAEAALS